ncbi:unnamed protein product [Amoebophrya sp. A25]|nr:unnamed protein product [Amoebophrya sp. A25]|eukprot:GSA25T00007364001.1
MSYFLEVNELAGRLQVILALFLTLFAIQWTLLERLPKFPFLTVLDNVAYAVIIALFLMGAGFCFAYFAARVRLVLPAADDSSTTTNVLHLAQNDHDLRKEFIIKFDLDKGEINGRPHLHHHSCLLPPLLLFAVQICFYRLFFEENADGWRLQSVEGWKGATK